MTEIRGNLTLGGSLMKAGSRLARVKERHARIEREFKEKQESEGQKLMERDDPRLTKLLRRLDREDEYSYRHLHHYKLKTYGDKKLLDDIERSYSKDRFRFSVSDLKEDCIGDEVGTIRSWHPFITTPEAEGVVVGVDGEKVNVDFYGMHCQLLDSDLFVYGRKGTWYRREKRYPETRGDYFNLEKDDLVKLQAEKKELLHCQLGEVKAMISRKSGDEYELIIPGIDNIKFHTSKYYLYVHRENNIDFGKLMKEYYDD